MKKTFEQHMMVMVIMMVVLLVVMMMIMMMSVLFSYLDRDISMSDVTSDLYKILGLALNPGGWQMLAG